MPNLGFMPSLDEEGFKMPVSVFEHLFICPDCNKLNFMTEKIKTCRFCGPDKDEFAALVKEVHEKNLRKQFEARKPRMAESNLCKICNRDHRKGVILQINKK